MADDLKGAERTRPGGRRFDALSELRTEADIAVEDQKATPKTGPMLWDFRHNEVPTGVSILGPGESTAKLEVQADKSTALVLGANTFLKLDLGVEANGGGRLLNDYTLTMDIKLPELPKDSMSLYQAQWEAKPTEGDVMVSRNGGVGVFGEYGVREAAIVPGKWTRVVVAIGGSWSNRRITTYVNGKQCSTISGTSRGVLNNKDNRFALALNALYLFASTKDAYMPGVAVKLIELRPSTVTAEEVKETANKNRIYSYWEIEKEQEETKRYLNMSLKDLYKRPPPIWMHPAFLAEFGDAFFEGTGLEGGTLAPALSVYAMIWERTLREQKSLLQHVSPDASVEHKLAHQLTLEDRQKLDDLSDVFSQAAALAKKFQTAASNPAQLTYFMKLLRKSLDELKEGEFLIVPGGIGQHPVLYILERLSSTFRVCLVNTFPLYGLGYHESEATQHPKIKYKTVMVLDQVAPSRVINDAFWGFAMKLALWPSKQNTPDKLYDLLLPFLADAPLSTVVADAQGDAAVEFRSPQRSNTAFFRTVLEASHYLMRRKGLSRPKSKLVAFAVRAQFLSCADNDLRFVGSISDSDLRVVKIACEQVAYTAVKHSKSGLLGIKELAEVKTNVESTQSFAEALPMEDGGDTSRVGPPMIDLDTNAGKDTQWGFFPFMERFQRKDDVNGLAGRPIIVPKYVPIDTLQLPVRVTNLEEAVEALRTCDRLCTLIAVQPHCIKNTAFLKVSLLQYTFTQLVPVPKPPSSEEYKECVWATPMRYALQLDILILLQRMCEHFAASAFSLRPNRALDAVRIIVPGCMSAIADCVLRKVATDMPSLLSQHYQGKSGGLPFGITTGAFGSQSETIEVHTPELNIARTGVLDYFDGLGVIDDTKFFAWEKSDAPEESLMTFFLGICRELAFPQDNPVLYLTGQGNLEWLILKNFPEFAPFRDIVFHWKYFLNPDKGAFPPQANYLQKQAELNWRFNPNAGVYQVEAYADQFVLACRPRPGISATYRYPSMATPSFLTAPLPVKTEDDVLHIKSLPSFDDVMGQKDSESLISYLTVPYLRLPLVMTFFSTEDRIHILSKEKAQEVLDSVLFEPGRFLPAGLKDIPLEVPTKRPELLATPYGLLLNELQRSPDTVLQSVIKLLKQALDLDTGSVHSSTRDVILYVMRTAARFENYVSFLVKWARGTHDTLTSGHLRGATADAAIHPSVLIVLEAGLKELRALLHGPVLKMLEDWTYECCKQMENKSDDRVVDENTRLACTLHTHILLLFRNMSMSELDFNVTSIILSSFIFLTTRHTWNMGLMVIPEFEMFELLQVQMRKIVTWLRSLKQGALNEVMEATVRVTTGTGIRVRRESDPLDFIRKWAFIRGEHSCGRFTIASSRRQEERKTEAGELDKVPVTVSDDSELGVEIDVQTAQLTLKSSHLAALDKIIANHPDVRSVFGSQSMQAATIETAEHRVWVRLVGRNHDVQFWRTPDPRPAEQVLDRDYVPGELEPSEQWIIPIFEPVRLTYMMKPFELRVCLPEKALSPDATVAYMIGIHPKKGGTWKEIFVFKDLRVVHVYDVVSYGRRFYRTLEYTSDARFCLRDMQPATDDREYPWPAWERYGCGHPYNAYPDPTSCVITRHKDLPANLSGTEETWIPARLLLGLIPQALLDSHQFWQDAHDNLRGYPLDKSPHFLHVQLADVKRVDVSRDPGICATVKRIPILPKGSEDVKSDKPKTLEEEEWQLVDLVHAPAGTPAYNLAKVLVRVEMLSYVLAWSRSKDPQHVYNVDLVELPRLKMTFSAKKDELGATRLYSLDHVDLFVSNYRSDLIERLIRGIPHSLVLANANNEIQILVPSIHPVRPAISSAPFSTELVLDRTDADWFQSLDTKYYLYPVHISLSFMFTPTLSSALYLLLLKFLNRDYVEVFRLVNGIGTDTEFTEEEQHIFMTLGEANGDCHPDAHAARLKISLVTIDSPVSCPWDLTKQFGKYVTKLSHVSTNCRLPREEEAQMIGNCITDVTDPRFDPKVYNVYEITLVKNRKFYLEALLSGETEAQCFTVPRSPDSGWPLLDDRTILSAQQRDWQSLALTCSAPAQLSGQELLQVVDAFWSGQEMLSGIVRQLGFLFLYQIFTGQIKCNMLKNDDSHTVATLLLQLVADGRSGGILSSILNQLQRNPELCRLVPKFKDTRRMKTVEYIGGRTEQEPESPLDDLFSELVPTMMSLVDNLRSNPTFPDPARQPRPSPRTTPIRREGPRAWVIPGLTDFMCDQRVLRTVSNGALSVDEATVQSFAKQPLQSVVLERFLAFQSRSDRGLEPVTPQLPFDVSRHMQAQSEVAKQMQKRLEEDIKVYSEQQNLGKAVQFIKLLDADSKRFASNPNDPEIDNALALTRTLVSDLSALKERDAQYVNRAIPEVISAANSVFSDEKSASLDQADSLDRYRFYLSRMCGQEGHIWIDMLVGALLSSKSIEDLQRVNPFFTAESVQATFDIVVAIILHANRVGHINRCIADARDLIGLLERAKSRKPSAAAPEDAALLAGLMQKGEALAKNINTKRFFIDKPAADGGILYDPRFLVFEFTWNIVLRSMQVVLVREFMDSIRAGRSIVKQMIMGAGKTTVVGPLLCLMLGDGKQLVTQVVPPALLEFSRSILRSTFSSIMYKRVYTLTADRSAKVEPSLFRKLQNAIQTQGVVVTTPTAVKSLQLKFVETLHMIEDPSRPRPQTLESDASELGRVLRLFRDGVLIMDEVDLILHPLKSELNFPIGEKHDLDFNPLRWKLPIHLLDAIFYAERGRMAVAFEDSSRAVTILDRVRAVLQEGYVLRALQRNPHVVLLNPDFYHERLKPEMVEWLLLWLETQHVAGIHEAQMRTYLEKGPHSDETIRNAVNSLETKHRKMLNLARDWLEHFLPHVMQKIDRVTFGLLSKSDLQRCLAQDPHMPRTRAKLAVPFVGKDVPSRSSEFAHPDVIIGLTVLAYRYEGLRWSDFMDIITHLTGTLTKEIGPYQERPSAVRHSKWVKEAGGRIRGEPAFTEEDDEATRARKIAESQTKPEMVPLRLLKRCSEEQMQPLFDLMFRLPDAIHWYLENFIFPSFMRHQLVKLSASGQDLGGAAMFGRRIGFSGTPSDLLPYELGRCGYEKGSDGLMVHLLTNPSVVGVTRVQEGWSVKSLLNLIATSQPPFRALIDTGALITGMSNLEVAQYLLANGLSDFEGVVFLDELDRKMILVRATGRVLKLAQCGIPAKKRFAFYDQVHTTGMDIQHTLDATAVLTLGKDMVFRDFAQGAFRMRGIGIGQKINLFIIPEVERLIQRELKAAHIPVAAAAAAGPAAGAEETKSSADVSQTLRDVVAWLVINSMRSERIQFNQLCFQNVANVWRKNAYNQLLTWHKTLKVSDLRCDHSVRRAIDVFTEPIDFSLEASVPVPVPFSQAIQKRVDANLDLIQGPEDQGVIKRVQDAVSGMVEVGQGLDVEQVQEREQEKQKEQEATVEQEIEIEKYVDLAYSRENEAPTPWPFRDLKEFKSCGSHFYPANDFKLYKRNPLAFPDYLMVSNNYFDKRWSGDRRIKNVTMVLEWLPDPEKLSLLPPPTEPLSADQDAALHKAFALFDQDNSGDITSEEVGKLIRSAMDHHPSPAELDMVMREFGRDGKLQYPDLRRLLQSGTFRQVQRNRYHVALSLAEAETIRRIMHAQLGQSLIKDAPTAVALRCVPAGNITFDVSQNFQRAAHAYQEEVGHQCLRFLNCDMYYKEGSLNVLVRSLQQSNIRERVNFFEKVMGCRRRLDRKWEETPLAKVFTLPDEYALLKQRAQAVRTREAIKAKGMLFYDAFRMFDFNRDGMLSPAELYGALDWLGLELTPADILDFINTFDTDRNGNIDYREFVDSIRDPDARPDEFEDSEGSGAAAAAAASEESGPAASASGDHKQLEFARIAPKGERELHELKLKYEAERARQADEEIKREQEAEAKIQVEKLQELVEQDSKQEGGPNPRIGPGSIRYDFTRGRRPLYMTTRGDVAYEEELGMFHLQVYKLGVLFLQIPFKGNAGGQCLNQYSLTLEMKLDSLPSGQFNQALLQTAKYNEDDGEVYIRRDGGVGVCGVFDGSGGPKLKAKQWHLVTITVDTPAGVMNTYVDGKPLAVVRSPEMKALDGRFAVKDQIALFGSKDPQETLGGFLRSAWFETRALPAKDIKAMYDAYAEERKWTCTNCTFRNQPSALRCAMCSCKRPVTASKSSSQEPWNCSRCTMQNAPSNDLCEVCEAPRDPSVMGDSRPFLTRSPSMEEQDDDF